VLLVPTFINKTIMVLLLCLIFIGQSMASMSMFYKMTAMQSSTQSMTGMSSMKDGHHMMETSDSSTHDMSTMPTEDCCEQECDCLTSSCSTVSAFSTTINSPPAFAIENKINSPIALITSQTLTSLYRPPILS